MSNIILGTKFNYQIDETHGIDRDGFIAEGTESLVYKGRKLGNGLSFSCTLKFKPKSRLRDFKEREYKILEAMQVCRSVVRVLDVIEDLKDFSCRYKGREISDKNYFCVVEEFIDGDSLQDFCIKQWFVYDEAQRRWRRNSVKYEYREIVKFQNQIVQFMINMCEIMKFVSEINEDSEKPNSNKTVVLHCDIKPENIMVTKNGKELVLIDFGRSQRSISRVYQYRKENGEPFSARYNDEQRQRDGKENLYAYGTIGYAAPECFAQAEGGNFPFTDQQHAFINGNISVESDIFGFGATFRECLSIYETGEKALKESSGTDQPDFFHRVIMEEYENNIRNGEVEKYCDRDFEGMDLAYHEELEKILKKCTHVRKEGFQEKQPSTEKYWNEYYHNFQSLQNDIEKARNLIPSVDRKSDPLVRNVLGISGFCIGMGLCSLVLWLVLVLFANPLAWDKWNTLKENYSANQILALRAVAEEMMRVHGKETQQRNFEEIIQFMYSGPPNDVVIDKDEAEILVAILEKHMYDEQWMRYIDIILQYGKSDNLDYITRYIYRMSIPEEYKDNSIGFILAKAIAQAYDADDTEIEKLLPAYQVLLEYKDYPGYETAISKLAVRLSTGRKVNTIAEELGEERETIHDILGPLIKSGGDEDGNSYK